MVDLRCIGLALALVLATGCTTASPPSEPDRREGFIETDDGVRLHYTSIGSGDDVVIIPVGFYLEDALAPLAKPGRRLLFYDPRCRGRSECSDLSVVSLDRQLSDLENLRAALRVDRFALLGFSGLGMEMAEYALRHPSRVERLVQVAPIPPSKAIMNAHGDRRNDRVDAAAVAALDVRIEAGEFEDDPERLCRLYGALTIGSNFADPARATLAPDVCVYENEWPKNLWPYFGALLPSFGDWDLTRRLDQLTMPRLVVHGLEDGMPLEGAEAWAEGDSARLLVLSPAGHFPFLERPDLFFPAVDRFLDGEWPASAE